MLRQRNSCVRESARLKRSLRVHLQAIQLVGITQMGMGVLGTNWRMFFDEVLNGKRLTVACYIYRYEDTTGAQCENAGCQFLTTWGLDIFFLVEFDAGVYGGYRFAETIKHGSTGSELKRELFWERMDSLFDR